jgi:predicted ABC-type ATPase
MTEATTDDFAQAVSSHDKLIVVLAGPNGAGKSTFFEAYLSATGILFVNADLIGRAKGLEGYEAAQEAEGVRQVLVENGVSFCMETVFSDPEGHKVDFLRDAQASGYTIVLVYVGLENQMLCTARVTQRVAAGGHDVPDDKIAARYERSLKNLAQAVRFFDVVYLFDNSSADEPYRRIAVFEGGAMVERCESLPEWAQTLVQD